jgi:hypothetical protein
MIIVHNLNIHNSPINSSGYFVSLPCSSTVLCGVSLFNAGIICRGVRTTTQTQTQGSTPERERERAIHREGEEGDVIPSFPSQNVPNPNTVVSPLSLDALIAQNKANAESLRPLEPLELRPLSAPQVPLNLPLDQRDRDPELGEGDNPDEVGEANHQLPNPLLQGGGGQPLLPPDLVTKIQKIRVALVVLYERIDASLRRLNILLPQTEEASRRNEILLERAQTYLLSLSHTRLFFYLGAGVTLVSAVYHVWKYRQLPFLQVFPFVSSFFSRLWQGQGQGQGGGNTSQVSPSPSQPSVPVSQTFTPNIHINLPPNPPVPSPLPPKQTSTFEDFLANNSATAFILGIFIPGVLSSAAKFFKFFKK